MQTPSPPSCVTVHAAQKIIHSEVGHDDAQECRGDEYVIAHRTAQLLQTAAVHGYGIHHEGYESPYLLGIPAPVTPPGHACPHRSGEYADGEGGKSRIEEQL